MTWQYDPPGTVAMLHLRFMYGETEVLAQMDEDGFWRSVRGHQVHAGSDNVVAARRVLVIDPEDPEQVEQLAKRHWDASGIPFTDAPWSRRGLRMQAALRAMLADRNIDDLRPTSRPIPDSREIKDAAARGYLRGVAQSVTTRDAGELRRGAGASIAITVIAWDLDDAQRSELLARVSLVAGDFPEVTVSSSRPAGSE